MTEPFPDSFTTFDGLRIACERFDGARPPAVLAIHATGFCKELWRPVVAVLDGAHPVLAIDQRGHGDSDTAPPPQRWSALGRDAASAAAFAGSPLIGVGHSSGGAALCLAELEAPGTFAALVLIEPIVFPRPFARVEESPLAVMAMRRRARFDSRAAARDNFAGKGPFARWTDEVLDLYVAHALRADDAGVVLKCAPEVEADFYREGTNHGAWDRLAEIACPVLVLAGEDSDTHPAEFVAELTGRFPRATSLVVPGTTHFLPMERPEVVADAVREVLTG